LRTLQIILMTLAQVLSSSNLQQLPYSRRVFMLTNQFLERAAVKTAPVTPGAAYGSVLVIFWTSERGAVVSARAIEGPPELQRAAIDAIAQWKFSASSIGVGQPVQIGSATIIDFSKTPPAILAPKPLTAAQLNPGFQFKCFEGLLRRDPSSVDVCRQQLTAVERDPKSSPMDRFTALDQYGLVLMKYANDPKQASEKFSQAISLAPGRLEPSDAEWSYAYWHRATAEEQSGNKAEAEKDFSIAESSLHDAQKVIGNEKIAAYYHDLLGKVVEQHSALLDGENKHDEAKRLRAEFGQ
jgi:hypothetical protein